MCSGLQQLAIQDMNVETLLDEAPDDVELREKLNNGLGVCVYFKEPGEARAFALDAEERLMTSIKKHFRPGDEGVGQ